MAEYINNTEYIDRKELVNNINRLVKLTNIEEQEWVKDECIRQAYCIQKADVVPRSEVEEAKQEVASKVIDEFKNLVINYMTNKELLLTVFKNAISHAETELKKKYIGE